MNNRRHRDEKLLAELFHDDWSNGPAAKFARRAAAHARARRRIRSAAAVAGAAGAVLILALVFTHRPTPSPVVALKPNPPAGYEIISDAELLAQLHDRPLLVLEKQNGTKEFVLLSP